MRENRHQLTEQRTVFEFHGVASDLFHFAQILNEDQNFVDLITIQNRKYPYLRLKRLPISTEQADIFELKNRVPLLRQNKRWEDLICSD